MQENRIIVLLTRQMAGEITAEEAAELAEALTEHPDTVYYEEFMRELWEGGKKPNIKIDQVYEQHKQRHQGRWFFNHEAISLVKKKTDLNRQKKKPVYLMAAFVCCIAMIGLLLQFGPWSGHRPPEEQMEIVAEKGVRKQLVLPDGTKIWLNADSRLTYNDFSKSASRSVHLEGEAYFDVAKDKEKPFFIETNKIFIQVLGTTFNVKAYPEDKKTEATLIQGAIVLSVHERPEEKILLKPNEKLAVTDASDLEKGPLSDKIRVTIGSLSKVHVDDKEYIQETSWVDDKLIFRDETLGELLPKIERWYNVEMKLMDPDIKAYRYTGTLTKENINQLLKAMQLVRFFNYKIENQHEIIIY